MSSQLRFQCLWIRTGTTDCLTWMCTTQRLHLRCDEAMANGLPEGPTERLRTFVTGPAVDCFRLLLANDPPADVQLIVVHFKDGLVATSKGCRRYNPRDSEFMAQFVTKLTNYNYVYRNQSATVVSHAYPVAKAGVSVDAPQSTIVVSTRVFGSCHWIRVASICSVLLLIRECTHRRG